jgi:hypothetical protein
MKFSRMMEDPELKAFLEPLLKDADSDGDGKPDVVGVKALFFKDGKFSKTATFAVLGNVLVLGNYALLSWFAGAAVDLSWIKFTVPAFDVSAAAAILGLLNSSYLGNNFLKNQASKSSAAE